VTSYPGSASQWVVVDEWSVTLYADHALDADTADRLRRRVDRALLRAARRLTRRGATAATVRVEH
jgi:hypothetical protein